MDPTERHRLPIGMGDNSGKFVINRRKQMYKVVVDYVPSQADNAVIREGIVASNENIVGERDKEFSIITS